MTHTDRQFQPQGPQPFAHVPNFARVSGGLLHLATAGAALVLDLRAEAFEPRAREKVEAAGMQYRRIPIVDHCAPLDSQAALFLAYVRDGALSPLFVHCAQGVGRTGTLVAAWRLTQGWTVRQALAEASLFHPRVAGVTVPIVGGIEPEQERWLRAWAATNGYPLGGE